RRLRTTLTTLAIAIGVMILSGLSSLLPTMAQSFRQNMLSAAGEVDITIGHVSGSPFSPTVLEVVRTTEGVARAGGLLRQAVLLPTSETAGTQVNSVTVVGLELDPAHQTRSYPIAEGRWLQPGDGDGVVVPASLAEQLGLAVGEVFTLPAAEGQVHLQIVGTVHTVALPGAEEVYMPLETAQRVLNLAGYINGIEVLVEAGQDREAVKDRLLERLGAGYSTVLPEFGQEFMTSMEIGEKFFQLIGILALIMGGFIIFNTFRTVVAERRYDMGILRAIGATRRSILRLILTESIMQGVVGTVAGLAAGYLLAVGTLAMIRPIARNFLRLELGEPIFSLADLFTAIVMGIGVTIVGGLWPALSAMRVTPLDALRPMLPSPEKRIVRTRTIIGMVMLAVAFFGLVSGNLAWSALGIVAFLVGMVLVTPALVHPLAHLLSTALAFVLQREGQLARGNLARQPGRAAITASTVMISIAIIVAVAGLTTSVYLGLDQYIRASLGADFLVMPSAMILSAGNLGAAPALAESIRETPGVAEVSTLRLGKTIVDGAVLQLVGVDPETYPRVAGLIFSAGDPQKAFQELGQGRAIIVNGVYALQAGVKVGQTLTLQTPEGRRDYTVVGIGVDFLNAKLATGYISHQNLESDFHITSDVLIMANVRPEADREAVRQAVEQRLVDYPNFVLFDSEDYRANTMRASQSSFALLFVIMLALTVPSLLGMMNTLAINIIERTREIGLLRAIGSTRRQVRRMIRSESLLLSALGTAFGLIAGVWLGYVLNDALNAGGFPMPFSFPLAGILLAIAAGILLGVAAAALPARQATRMDIVSALRYE
ncbi:MAG: ABC transporter permease, partial [Anaerolineae bacterium]